ncbi:glycoside hydrolase family 6 protein [Streptomyces bohaiensis]|uniref:Glucanase n=1 Tax=Streptomyces bohaiensis TaxID=1431344 RepID=A0ABX1CA50_9ACTN|nr:glycoside hydrolase family 6 protein [Streptomyces bohaiensis]NJQ14788.1 glycoside hydrolase family 6 protein [Streptomyces bohaiensis]
MENPRTTPTPTPLRRRRSERRARGGRVLTALTGVTLLAGLAIAPAATGASPSPAPPASPASSADSGTADAGTTALPSMELYRAEAGVHAWLDANPGDHRAPLIAERIGSQPQAVWFAGAYNPGTITQQVAEVTSAAAAAGQLPVVVPYMIPFRDCGNHSGGGAPSFAAYAEWSGLFAAGLGSEPVVVVLEPDAIPLIDCLDNQQRAERLAALAGLAEAVTDANPEARVYYDVGHSAWHTPAAIAPTLVEAGILEHGAGIATNISNYRTTTDETAYASAVIAELGGGLGAVVDTSRNGNGPLGSEWCDPPGRLVGNNPTVNPGVPGVDAFLWIKLPGELDGCDGPAGSFSPAKAYELAGG